MASEVEQLSESIEELRRRLDETEETLRAIRRGEVDALVVWTSGGDKVFTLQGADHVYRIMVESMSEAACTLAADRTVLFGNRRLAEMVGMPLPQLVGSSIDGLVADSDLERFHALLSQAADAAAHGEVALRSADGRLVPSYLAVNPLPETTGAAVCLVATDLTELKQVEQELRRLSQELEARVEQRTAALRASNRELEDFAYSVSHDLRAPLRAIDGFSLALLEDCADELDEHGRDYLRRVRTAAQRMGALIDDVLNLSRLSRARLRRREVDLSAIAREAVRELGEREPDRMVELVVADGLVAQADRTLVRALLENLLGNAWKFTAPHETARIELGETVLDGEPVYFVRDDGVGFDMAYADKLFAPFQRMHPTEEFAGTGIGLATVRSIVRRHGGRVWAEAQPDKGATFYFTLAAT